MQHNTPLSPRKLATIPDNTTGWYASEISYGTRAMYRRYKHQFPIGTPPNALYRPDAKIRLRWRADPEVYRFDNEYGANSAPLIAKYTQLTGEFKQTVKQHSQYYSQFLLHDTRNPHDTPKYVLDILADEFDTFYEFLKTAPHDLDISNNDVEHLSNPDQNTPVRIDWCCYTLCPECGEEFWSGYPTELHRHNTADTPSAGELAPITYCPVCEFDAFTPPYLIQPVPANQRSLTQIEETYTTS